MFAATYNPNKTRTMGPSIAAGVIASAALHAIILYSLSRVQFQPAASRLAAAGTILTLDPADLSPLSKLNDPRSKPPADAAAPPPPPPPPKLPKPVEAPTPQPKPTHEVLPGIDGSTAITTAWIGFLEETRHQMMPGVVEQSALSPTPGTPVPPGPTSDQPAQPTAEATLASAPATAPPTPPPTPPSPPPTPPQQSAKADTTPLAPQPPPSAREKPPALPDPAAQPAPTPNVERPIPGPERIVPPTPRNDDVTKAGPEAPERAPGETNPQPKRERSPQAPPAPPPTPKAEETPDRADDHPKDESREKTEKPTPPREPNLIPPTLANPTPPQPETPADKSSTEAPPTPPQSSPPGPARDKASPPQTPGVPKAGDRPSIKSTSEADGTSIAKAAPYRFVPGQIRARKGLQVTTVRPKFSLTTQVLGLARNTYVRIQFQRDGTVKKVTFLDGSGSDPTDDRGGGTGNPSVDGPLKFALYAWTAKGEELNRLQGLDDTADMVIKIIFHDEPADSAEEP